MKRLSTFLAALAVLAAALFGGPRGSAWAKPHEPSGPATLYLTAKDTNDRLAAKGSLPFEPLAQPLESALTIIVDPARTFQTIEGIGGALTDAAAETFHRLPAAEQSALLRAYFDPVLGIGYTLARTHINSCDFSSGSYAYVEEPGDTALKSFSIGHDLKYRLPFIKRILSASPGLKIFASPWSPPAWMKSNQNMLQGGALKPEYREAWARYYVRFLQEYALQGVPLWGLTVQNEPLAVQTWESCIYTAEEERDFVKGFLGPALRDAGFGGVKLMIWDHNRDLLYQRAGTVLADPGAARFIWGTAFHWYSGEEFENVGRVHEAFPAKALLFSEGCHGPFNWDTMNDWGWGEGYGLSMIKDFNQWTCGWTDWNVLLDERGGPNHVGNYCFAPVHGDTRTGKLHFMNSFYYIGHFSKFVRPGAKRVACSTTNDDFPATAFINTDGRKAAIVMNPTEKAREVQLWSAGRAVKTSLPAHSIATFVWK